MSENSDEKTLLLKNQLDELPLVVTYLDQLGEEWGLSEALVSSLNLVLEEALSNIILYGFDDELLHNITLYFSRIGNELLISIVDDGHFYDPTQKADPDITLPVEDRPVGGLGIFLIKRIMDKVEYQRKENKNILILKKNIEP
jgi:serine/threonine-protein kinase RsbW